MKKPETDIWEAPPHVHEGVGVLHIVLTSFLIGVGAALGAFGSFTFPLGFGVNFLWPGIVVQNVGGIWFGAWGVIASALFPIISNGLTGAPVLLSLAYMPANALQAFIPGLAFRILNADPSLRGGRDWMVFLGSITLANLIGSAWSALVVLPAFKLTVSGTQGLYMWGWFAGNEIPGVIFGSLVMYLFSRRIMRGVLFIRGWWV
jgi:hypothetical protein